MTKNYRRQSRNLRICKSILIFFWIPAIFVAADSPAAFGQLNLDRLRAASQSGNADKKEEKSAGKSLDRLNGLRPLGSTPAAESDSDSEFPATVGGTNAPLMFGTAPFDLNTLQPLFKTPELDAGSESGPVLQHEAEKTLQAGDQTTAMQLMFGHMVAEYEDARPTLLKVKFNKQLNRPVWNVRFGVSMWVRDVGVGDEDPNPIPAEGVARTRVGFSNRAPAANQDRGNARAARQRGAATLADAFNSRSGDRRARATPSRAKKSDSAAKAGDKKDGQKASDSAKANLAGQLDKSKKVTSKPAPTLEAMLGLVAQVVGEEFSIRYERGDFGPLLADLSNTASDESSPTANTTPASASGLGSLRLETPRPAEAESKKPVSQVLTSANSLPVWKPGIVNLGSGSRKEMIEKARKSNLDFLIHFEVNLKSRPDKPVQNASRCRLLNVATGKSIGLSKLMDSNEEKKLAGSGTGGRDYVGEKIENLLATIDSEAKVTDLPKLAPAVARRRLGGLLGNSEQRSLRTLAEIRVYEMRKLLTPDQVEMAFEIVGGADSLLFLYGSAEERAALARAWAAESGKKNDS